MLSRILGFVAVLLTLASIGGESAAAVALRGVRVWPADDYTRVTLESDQALRYSITLVRDPDRLVLDLEDMEPSALPANLASRFADDPYVKGVRTGRFKANVTRLVFDLKAGVKPQVFALPPVGEYRHRLVLDIYPVEPPDPLLALIARQKASPAEAQESASLRRPEGEAPAAGEDTAANGAEQRRPSIFARAKKRAPVDPYQRTLTIVFDAGHGGEDSGARGAGGSLEKHVTLAIARRLKALVDAEPYLRAVLTRDTDFFIPLPMRVDKARRARADLFVSIHADSWVSPEARGSSVFALSERGATSAAARWLARRENDADLIGGVNLDVKDRHLAQTLLDLSQTATITDSLKLGRAVLSELGGVNRLHKNYVEQASFAVLKAPDIPSILVETAFISNPEEERRLNDDAYQDQLARAIVTGIKRYLARNPPVNRSTFAALDACGSAGDCMRR